MSQRVLVFFFSFALVLLAGACASRSAVAGETQAPEVRLGEPIELLKVRGGKARVKAVADTGGNAHVIVASEELRQVIDVIVTSEGSVQKQLIRSDVYPAEIDGAFNSKGQLHVLIDSMMLYVEDGNWREVEPKWWQRGEGTGNWRFVANARDLILVGQVEGSKIESPARIEIFLLGAPGGIVFPWFTSGTRTVLGAVSGSEVDQWAVIEPQTKEDTFADLVIADSDGDVHVNYWRSRGAYPIFYYSLMNHAKISRDFFYTKPADALTSKNRQGVARKLVGIVGEPIGKDMLVIGKVDDVPLMVSRPCPSDTVCLVAGSGSTFYALTLGEARKTKSGEGRPVQLHSLMDQGLYPDWSKPVEVGFADVGSIWVSEWEASGIVAVGKNRVFIIWPTAGSLMGRWIEKM